MKKNLIETILLNNQIYYLDKEIVVLEEPILSVYISEDKYYLLSCLDMDELKYLFFPIVPETLVSLLNDTTTIYNAYISGNYVVLEFDENYIVEKNIEYSLGELPHKYTPLKEKLGISEVPHVKEYYHHLHGRICSSEIYSDYLTISELISVNTIDTSIFSLVKSEGEFFNRKWSGSEVKQRTGSFAQEFVMSENGQLDKTNADIGVRTLKMISELIIKNNGPDLSTELEKMATKKNTYFEL